MAITKITRLTFASDLKKRFSDMHVIDKLFMNALSGDMEQVKSELDEMADEIPMLIDISHVYAVATKVKVPTANRYVFSLYLDCMNEDMLTIYAPEVEFEDFMKAWKNPYTVRVTRKTFASVLKDKDLGTVGMLMGSLLGGKDKVDEVLSDLADEIEMFIDVRHVYSISGPKRVEETDEIIWEIYIDCRDAKNCMLMIANEGIDEFLTVWNKVKKDS